MTTKIENPQRPDPYCPKMRLSEWCSRYGISETTGLRWIAQNRIPAEQPGGPGTTWFVHLDREDDEDDNGEAMLLEEVRRGTEAA